MSLPLSAPRPRPYENPGLWEASGGALRPGGTRLTERSLAACPPGGGRRALDIGCGLGASLPLLAARGYEPWGLDASPALLARAAVPGSGAMLIRADAHRPPLEPGSLGLVLAECVLSLLPRPREALAAWGDLLAPGGGLIISDLHARGGAGDGSGDDRPPASCLEGAVSVEESLRRVEEAGFRVILYEDHTRLLREFAARLVFELGREALGLILGSRECRGGCSTQAVRPGYHLLIAARREG